MASDTETPFQEDFLQKIIAVNFGSSEFLWYTCFGTEPEPYLATSNVRVLGTNFNYTVDGTVPKPTPQQSGPTAPSIPLGSYANPVSNPVSNDALGFYKAWTSWAYTDKHVSPADADVISMFMSPGLLVPPRSRRPYFDLMFTPIGRPLVSVVLRYGKIADGFDEVDLAQSDDYEEYDFVTPQGSFVVVRVNHKEKSLTVLAAP